MTAAAIVRILSVRDTRDFIEDGDRWVAVPGSGLARACDRCGRDHEIHVDVELACGAVSTIGQGCARGDSMDRAIRTAAGRARRRCRVPRTAARVP